MQGSIMLVGLVIFSGFFMSWNSGPEAVRDFSVSPGPVSIGLSRWSGQDFSIVPDFSQIHVQTRQLPEGRFAARTFPLPRDLNRDFPLEERGRRTYFYARSVVMSGGSYAVAGNIGGYRYYHGI